MAEAEAAEPKSASFAAARFRDYHPRGVESSLVTLQLQGDPMRYAMEG